MKKTSLSISFIFFLSSLLPGTASARHQDGITPKPYKKSSGNITLVCELPCPFKKNKMDMAFDSLDDDFHMIEENIKLPFPEERKPIEMHIYFDRKCKKLSRASTARPDVVGFTRIKKNGKAIICLRASADDVIDKGTYFKHEVAHHYLPSFSLPEERAFVETLAEAFTSAVNGKFQTLCGPIFKKLEPDLYALCAQEGFDLKDMPELIKRIREYQNTGKQMTYEELLRELRQIAQSP